MDLETLSSLFIYKSNLQRGDVKDRWVTTISCNWLLVAIGDQWPIMGQSPNNPKAIRKLLLCLLPMFGAWMSCVTITAFLTRKVLFLVIKKRKGIRNETAMNIHYLSSVLHLNVNLLRTSQMSLGKKNPAHAGF